ncbi:hypothetical protein DY000_02004822 [Brassica cretica]|uniref:RecA family profile 1 domain-containing protein n=1 Tax=Brassica cretica TaxID=69181 RepID=A0ABQ7C7K4_BRACR|nr:hypothetical protein DY000_02004822 [Brassica cretica]
MLSALKSEETSQMQLVEREEIDDDDDLFEAIDKLIAQGINAGDVKKLQDAGIHTCNGLMMHTKKNFGYMTGSDALLKRKSVVRITTGCQALDDLLGGGIETSAITEAFGEFRSGKTQLAHTLCDTTQAGFIPKVLLPKNMKGGNGKVAYIDTEGTFRPDRIVPIAERFGMDPGAVRDNHQYNLLLGLAEKMSEEPFKILQRLSQMLSRITKIAEEFNVAVYMTNQVIPDPGVMFLPYPKKPAGGHVLAHAVTIRLSFRKGKGEQRVCKVFDAPNLREAEAISFFNKSITTCYSSIMHNFVFLNKKKAHLPDYFRKRCRCQRLEPA